MSLKIIITGGAGFIGSTLIKRILSSTIHSVVNIDKLTYAGNLISLKSISHNPRYIFEKVDICDSTQIKRIFEEHQPDLIMNLAAESHVDNSIYEPIQFINTNIFGTYNLLENSKNYWMKLKGLKKDNFRFHHISTDEVYGDLPHPDNYSGKLTLFHESSPYLPSSPYSASKASSDHLVRAWNRTYGLPVIISNCSNNFGPYQFPEKLIPLTILNAIKGKKIPIYGNGKNIRDWLYVEDHVSALILVAFKGRIGETYNIGAHQERKNIDVVKNICSILKEIHPFNDRSLKKTNYENLIQFIKDRPGHDNRYAIDSKKINLELNWKPQETFESGLFKTVSWYLNNQIWCEKVLNLK